MTTKKLITTEEVRSLFLNYFKRQRIIQIVSSSSLMPHEDRHSFIH